MFRAFRFYSLLPVPKDLLIHPEVTKMKHESIDHVEFPDKSTRPNRIAYAASPFLVPFSGTVRRHLENTSK